MSKKEEVPIIHPRQIRLALEGFNNDVMMLLTAARNAVSFLSDDSLDPEKTRKAVSPSLKEAAERVAKWYGA